MMARNELHRADAGPEMARATRCARSLMTLAAIGGLAISLESLAIPILVAASASVAATLWHPSRELWRRIEWAWVIVLIFACLRTGHALWGWDGDVLRPLLLLLCLFVASEVLRPMGGGRRSTLHVLSLFVVVGGAIYVPGLAFLPFVFTYLFFLCRTFLLDSYGPEASFRRLDRGALLRASFLLWGGVVVGGLLAFAVVPRAPTDFAPAGGGASEERVAAGFAESIDLTSFGGEEIAELEATALRIEFEEGAAPDNPQGLYVRGRSYDVFDGQRWRASMRPGPDGAEYHEAWGEEQLRYRVYDVGTGASVLFGLHPVVEMEARGAWRVRADGAGNRYGDPASYRAYEAVSLEGSPSEERLSRVRPRDARDGAPERYTALPRLDDRVHSLAEDLAQGADGQLEMVERMVAYFHQEFGYTRSLPDTPHEATMEGFLFDRREGHCEYFSSALVLLLRSVGVPARNVNGFLGGEWNEGGSYLSVPQARAHSWVEVWFPEAGWIPFDPTPGGLGDGSGLIGPDGEVSEAWLGWGEPGRLQMAWDGVEHRWVRFLTDYEGVSPLDLLGGLVRIGESVRDVAISVLVRVDRLFRDFGPWAWGTLVLSLLAIGLMVGRLLRARLRDPDRLISAMEKFYRRHGYGGRSGPADTRRDFLRVLERQGAPHIPLARRAVRIYEEIRFGGGPLGVSPEVRALELRSVVTQLRARLSPNPLRTRGAKREPWSSSSEGGAL